MTDEKKGMLAAGTAYSIFGLSYLFSKMALDVTEPMILLCVRFSVTFILLNLLLIFRVFKVHYRGKNIGAAILVGIVQPVLYFVFENYGLKYTTTSFTGIIASVSPIFATVLGVICLKEIPGKKQWLGIGLAIIGVMMVSLGDTGGENTVIGCICLFLAYLLGAYYSILIRKLSGQFSAFEITYVMFVVGFIFFVIMAFVQFRGNTVAMIADALSHTEFIISCLYLGGLASVGAYMLSNYSLGRLPVSRSAIFGCLATVVSVLSGVIIMKDPFSWVSAIAFVLILGGVYMVNRFTGEKG